VIAELAALPPTDVGTRAQLDQLALAYEGAYKYAWRAWRACGTVPVGSGSGSASTTP
jgi:hypothetical protein